MNNFTKEELLHIFDSVNTDAKYFGEEHIAIQILKKLESMIDNYCEHEPNYDTLTLRYEKLGILNYFDRCKKCG